MPPTSSPPWPRQLATVFAGVALVVAVTTLLVTLALRCLDPANFSPDFIQFWTAATLLARGQNPYDPSLQAAIQQGLGWTKAGEGLGIYDFLPYYYPPWLAQAFRPFLLLDYPVAKFTWMVLSGEFVLMAAALLRERVRTLSPGLVFVVVGLFGFTIKAVAMGQVAPLVLLLLAIAWTLLEGRRDVAAGVVLALLTIKPQLTLLLIGAVLCWTLLQRRWAVSISFFLTLCVLCYSSTLTYHGWLNALLGATRVTPMPTAYFPGIGATWFVALGAVGLQGALLYLAYAALALPFVLELSRLVLTVSPLEDLLAVSMLAPFFVAPYARAYDFPVLLLPALVLMATHLPPMLKWLMAAALTLLVGEHILLVTTNLEPAIVGIRRPEFTYFWIPILLALTWLCYARNGSRERSSAGTANRD